MDERLPPLATVHYEMLPFTSAEAEAAAVGHPLTLTVTCSPRQELERGLEVAARLRALGHTVVVHLAARLVRDRRHLDALLAAMAETGVGDVFLVGGDSETPLGPFASALELLPELRAHPHAPRTIGVAAYPEGHPLIADTTLAQVLAAKAEQADYMTTQMCYDARVLTRWLADTRQAGVQLPAYIGLPGIVDARRLLEVSARVGVGASLSFLRTQRGVRRLLTRRSHLATDLYRATAPLIGGPLDVIGVHFYTFNRLVATVAFAERERERAAAGRRRSARGPVGLSAIGSDLTE